MKKGEIFGLVAGVAMFASCADKSDDKTYVDDVRINTDTVEKRAFVQIASHLVDDDGDAYQNASLRYEIVSYQSQFTDSSVFLYSLPTSGNVPADSVEDYMWSRAEISEGSYLSRGNQRTKMEYEDGDAAIKQGDALRKAVTEMTVLTEQKMGYECTASKCPAIEVALKPVRR